MSYKIKVINKNVLTEKQLKDTYTELDDFQKSKIIKMPKERQISFLAGRYLLLNEGINITKIYYNDNGKPLIDGMYFSISHSFEYTVVVISKKPIGVDIEKIRKIDNKVKMFLLKDDYNNQDFFESFTKKEAYIKLNGLALKNLNDEFENCVFDNIINENYCISICQPN